MCTFGIVCSNAIVKNINAKKTAENFSTDFKVILLP